MRLLFSKLLSRLIESPRERKILLNYNRNIFFGGFLKFSSIVIRFNFEWDDYIARNKDVCRRLEPFWKGAFVRISRKQAFQFGSFSNRVIRQIEDWACLPEILQSETRASINYKQTKKFHHFRNLKGFCLISANKELIAEVLSSPEISIIKANIGWL